MTVDPNGLSQEAYYFIGGLMRHVKGNVCDHQSAGQFLQTFGSGFEALVYIAWSGK